MSKEQALAMLSDAEGHLWGFIPPQHFVSEHPVEYAAITELQNASRELKREMRKERGL